MFQGTGDIVFVRNTQTTPPSSGSGGGLTTAAIVGIVVGGVVALCAVAVRKWPWGGGVGWDRMGGGPARGCRCCGRPRCAGFVLGCALSVAWHAHPLQACSPAWQRPVPPAGGCILSCPPPHCVHLVQWCTWWRPAAGSASLSAPLGSAWRSEQPAARQRLMRRRRRQQRTQGGGRRTATAWR